MRRTFPSNLNRLVQQLFGTIAHLPRLTAKLLLLWMAGISAYFFCIVYNRLAFTGRFGINEALGFFLPGS